METTINKWRPWEILGISFSLKLDQSEFQKSKGVKMILFHSHFLKVHTFMCNIKNFFVNLTCYFMSQVFSFYARLIYLFSIHLQNQKANSWATNSTNQNKTRQNGGRIVRTFLVNILSPLSKPKYLWKTKLKKIKRYRDYIFVKLLAVTRDRSSISLFLPTFLIQYCKLKII